jgi:hypothetical protein
MAFSKTWVEAEPDGAVITVSELDNAIRDVKVAVRERMEGDAAAPLTGIFETNTFDDAPMPRLGSGRFYAGAFATLGAVTRQNGRGFFTTDADSNANPRLFSLEAGGAREIAYLNVNGSRHMEGQLSVFITGALTFRADGNEVILGANNTNVAKTTGYTWLPYVAGAPTGNPGLKAGLLPITIDEAAKRMYFRDGGGTWRFVQFT